MSEYISKKWLKEHIEVISYEGMWHETEVDEFVSVENIDSAPSIKTKQIKYFDEDEKVWKIGEVIVRDSEKPNNSMERSSE